MKLLQRQRAAGFISLRLLLWTLVAGLVGYSVVYLFVSYYPPLPRL